MNKTFFEKLLSAQKNIGTIAKEKTNPFFKSHYADINAIIEMVKPALNDEGLVLTQALSHVDGKPAIETKITDGEKEIISITPLLENSDPQKFGAIITYFRRYALQSLLALQAEDDDGNSVSNLAKNDTYSNKTTQSAINTLSTYKKPIQGENKAWMTDDQFKEAIKKCVEAGTIKIGADPKEVMKILRIKYAVAKKYEDMVSEEIDKNALQV